MRTLIAAVAALALLPASAAAHVTIAPATAPPGDAIETLSVPNEMSDATTTKLDVQLPPGFVSARPKVLPGWSVKIRSSKLAKPVQTDDGPIDEQITRVTWTAGKGAPIPVGQYQEFPLALLILQKPGTKLPFKALQTYSNGKVVRWIGAPDDEEPAALLTVGAEAGAAAAPARAPVATASKAPAAAAEKSSGNTLAIVGVVLGGLALLLAAFSLLRTPTPKESA